MSVKLNWSSPDAFEAAVAEEGMTFRENQEQLQDLYLSPQFVRTNSIPAAILPTSWVEPEEDISSSATSSEDNLPNQRPTAYGLIGLGGVETVTSSSAGTSRESTISLHLQSLGEVNTEAKALVADSKQLALVEETVPHGVHCCFNTKTITSGDEGQPSSKLPSSRRLAPEVAASGIASSQEFDQPDITAAAPSPGNGSWLAPDQTAVTEEETDGKKSRIGSSPVTARGRGSPGRMNLQIADDTTLSEESSVGLNTLDFSKIVQSASAAAGDALSKDPNISLNSSGLIMKVSQTDLKIPWYSLILFKGSDHKGSFLV